MELESIPQFLENKTILVTGATGFLAKAFVEKILRVQPNVKRLYLLIRASDIASATQRLHNEVIEKDLFRVVREKWGANLDSFISEKVFAVPGDVSDENLGVKDSKLREDMWKEIDIILNSAASTSFDERYDVALGINTFGALHLSGFARNCINLKVLLHLSTAYVCGEKKGRILESPFQMEETLDGSSRILDIGAEKEVVEEHLNKLRRQGATDREIKSAMKDLGIERAKLYGWPNTYVFTKAMGEMLLGRFRENLPLVIIRPTMVSSTYKEPFSGWIEGVRTIDGVIAAYGKGKLKCFLGHHETILDIIPADMVVNCMVVAMVACANQSSEIILHVGSSWSNPIKLSSLKNFISRYFTENPLVSKKGKSIKVNKLIAFSSMASFRAYMVVRYILPFKVFQIVNTVIGQYSQDVIIDLKGKIKSGMRLAKLYKPYVFFTGSFDDSNTEKLRMNTCESGVDVHLFGFDPKCIDWEDYLMNTHIPGLIKYALK